LGTSEAAAHYQWLCENTEEWQWSRSWLPLTHEGWNQCGIEVGSDQPGILIDASFPDPPRAIAPSLVALLHASCAVIEAGLYDEEPVRTRDGTYRRVKQRAVIKPTFSLYAATPDHLAEG
jgi:hypothetical protein